MPTRQTPTTLDLRFDVVNPLKERACDALSIALWGRQRRGDSDQQLMRKGAERC